MGALSLVFPSVMLSPNARNFVFSSWGIGVTTTEKLQPALWPRESVASHVTPVMPLLNGVPDAGLQATVTGGAPLSGRGVSNATVGMAPLCAMTDTSAGQFRMGSSMTGVGCTLELQRSVRPASTRMLRCLASFTERPL